MKRTEYIPDEVVVRRAREAVALELQKKKAMDAPAIVYDRTTKKIYRINSDGTRVAVDDGSIGVNYSDRT